MDDIIRRVFADTRTHNGFQEREVSEDTLRELYDLTKMSATSFNCLPLRLRFLKSEAAKRRVLPHLSAGNAEKTRRAPVCVILAMDLDFARDLPKNFPAIDAAAMFVGKNQLVHDTAFRNSSLQGGYFLKACNVLGLDTGPMSGFDHAGVDAEFFADSNIKSNFLCNIGYGDSDAVYPRGPRYAFDEVAEIL